MKKESERRRRVKKDFFEKAVLWIGKYITMIIVILAVVCFVTPVVLCLFTCDNISDDGWLSYVGAIMGSIVTFFVSFIALYEVKKNHEFQLEIENTKRKNEIFPDLHISLEKTESESISMRIENKSKNSAVGVNLFGNDLFDRIDGGRNEIIKLNRSTYPDNIILVYANIDDNIIVRSFILSDGNYIPKSTEYDS